MGLVEGLAEELEEVLVQGVAVDSLIQLLTHIISELAWFDEEERSRSYLAEENPNGGYFIIIDGLIIFRIYASCLVSVYPWAHNQLLKLTAEISPDKLDEFV